MTHGFRVMLFFDGISLFPCIGSLGWLGSVEIGRVYFKGGETSVTVVTVVTAPCRHHWHLGQFTQFPTHPEVQYCHLYSSFHLIDHVECLRNAEFCGFALIRLYETYLHAGYYDAAGSSI